MAADTRQHVFISGGNMEKGKEMGFQLYILLFFNQEKNNFPESPLLVIEPSTRSQFPFVFHWPGLGLAARNSG